MTDQLPAEIAEAIERACKLAGLFSASLWPDSYHDRATLSCHYNEARASLDAVILKHLGQTSELNLQMVRVPRLFDAEAEDKAWQVWREGGRHHEAFINCINAYVEAAAVSATDLGRSALADEGRGT